MCPGIYWRYFYFRSFIADPDFTSYKKKPKPPFYKGNVGENILLYIDPALPVDTIVVSYK